MLRIAIDAMGGDFGPEPIMEGLVAALKKNNNFTAIAVGKKDEILTSENLSEIFETKISVKKKNERYFIEEIL